MPLTKAGVNVFAYGNFITVLINFLLLALGVFIIVKLANKVVAEKEEAPAEPSEDVVLLREIRDSLKNKPRRIPCNLSKKATGFNQWLFIALTEPYPMRSARKCAL